MDRLLLGDLQAEQQVLDDLLGGLDDAAWQAPTPAAGWTIADTVRHLVVAERAATVSVRDRRDFVAAAHVPSAPSQDAVDARVLLQAWRDARRSTLDALAATPDAERVPWGGRLMAVRSLATARVMETWAHGLDCFAAAGREPVDTDRLRHVAWLGWRTLPYAFQIAGEQPPAPLDALRIELTAPSGAAWVFGSEPSEPGVDCEPGVHIVRGDASVWCRVVTRRWRLPSPPPLDTRGELAVAAVRVAQAYLDAS